MNRKYINTTPQEVMEDITSGQAIPAIDILKRTIIELLTFISIKEREMRLNLLINNGNPQEKYKNEFATSLIFLFNEVKGMTREKGIYNQWSAVTPSQPIPKGSDYYMLEQLEYNRRRFSIEELINFKNYLIYILHKLNLTNLLIEANIDIERSIREEW